MTFQARCVRVLNALRVHDQQRGHGVAPQSLAGRANLIFYSLLQQAAALVRLTPDCKVLVHRTSPGKLPSMRHWQPLLSRYSTAQNTP